MENRKEKPIKHQQEYRDPYIIKALTDEIKNRSRNPVRLMEVCGTHTMSIFRHGIRSILPENISLLSGPGCPVCVTSQQDIDFFIEISGQPDVITATFGDLMRVPGSKSSLQRERALGREIHVVYSPCDAVKLAQENPHKKIVFPGVGFETTAPAVATSIIMAEENDLDNFYVYSSHKLVPPALEALMSDENAAVDGFILPGHVSVIIGTSAYRSFFDKYNIPCAVTGFEPADILKGILSLVEQIEKGEPFLANEYKRAVTAKGNKMAADIMYGVFKVCDTDWRGLGTIDNSGLEIRKMYKRYDASENFDISLTKTEEIEGCICGEILSGSKIPLNCPLYKRECTPLEPAGPCMVSTEGTCAAYYRYYS